MPRASAKTLSTALIIIVLLTPTLASPVSAWFVRVDPLKSSLASLPDEPLGIAPLTLWRQAYEAIRSIPCMESMEADYSAFADRARLKSADPIDGDLRLVKELVKVYGSSGEDPSTRDAAALAVVLLVRADRDAARVALADAGVLVDGDARSALQKQLSKRLDGARGDYDRAMDSLRKGDLDKAIKRLASSLASSLEALSLMGISYAPESDAEGDGLIDIIELRAGSSPVMNDTDGDGMGDYYEVFSLIPYCMPGDADTDDDGVPDGSEDTDEDGFANIDEMTAGTNPLDADDPGMLLSHEASDPLALGSPGDGLKVLLDLFHGEWDGSRVENMTLPINTHDLLEENGFAVDVNLNSPLDTIDLSGYDALLIPSPMYSFTPAELDAIKAFVSSGGGLLASCDTQMSHGITAPNEIAGAFGIRFRSEWYANDSIAAPMHPIMAGLSDGDIFQPFMLFDAAIDRYAANATLLMDGSYVTSPSMVALEYGSGRAVFGPNNGLCQPWGKGIDGDAYYARDVPNVLLIRTVEWLCSGSVTPPPPPPEGEDSDRDGLSDAAELAGLTNQYGTVLMTDPYAGDTDGDGLWDGDEAGEWNGVYYIMGSDPTLNDTDWDWVEDYVELDELVGTDPMLRDTDNDVLWDGEELYEYGTDPLNPDTDGDGDGDQSEIAWGMDPLLYTERWDLLTATHEFCLGLVAGEFAMDGHGNMPFFSGLMSGGAVSLVPGPGWLVGFLFDLRDFLAALCRGDWSGLGINSLALLPYVGDAADIAGTVARFALKHPEMAGGIGIFMARMDWASGAAKIASVRASVGDAVVDGLVAKGLSEAKVLKLARGGVNLANVDERFAPLFTKYPGMKAFFEGVDVAELDDGTTILRGNTLTLNIKRLGVEKNPNTVATMLGAIEGAYTQVAMVNAKVADGWRVISKVEHYCGQGYDLIVQKSGKIRLMEAKAGDKVGINNLKNLFHVDREKNIVFNDRYFFKKINNNKVLRDAFNEGQLQIEVFINNPNHAKNIDLMKKAIGVGPNEKIFATYENDYGFQHLVEIIFTGVLI